MRSLFVLGLLLTGALVWAATVPNTPPDGSPDAHPYCLLDSLQFSNGLELIGGFQPNKFNYICTCENFDQPVFTTVVTPRMQDPGSSAEITFNGVQLMSRAQNNAISNEGHLSHSPNTQSGPLTFVTGHNEIIVGIACNERVNCYYEYRITCEKPEGGGHVVGDPQFHGLRGQQYQVHGVSGEVYNIVSDPDLQYNSRFVFLEQGECPVVNGRKQKGCWSHPGSYLGEIGIKTRLGDRIRLNSGPAKQGFEAVEVNGRSLEEGDVVLLEGDLGSVSRNSTHLATVSVGNWEFAFENSDMFVNQRVRVMDPRRLRSHGLLGQTWRENTYPNAIKYIQGEVDDYVIRDNDVFGDNFVFNAFN